MKIDRIYDSAVEELASQIPIFDFADADGSRAVLEEGSLWIPGRWRKKPDSKAAKGLCLPIYRNGNLPGEQVTIYKN